MKTTLILLSPFILVLNVIITYFAYHFILSYSFGVFEDLVFMSWMFTTLTVISQSIYVLHKLDLM